MGRPLDPLRRSKVARWRLGRWENPGTAQTLKWSENFMVPLDNWKVEAPAVLGDGKMNAIFMDILPL
jgi:hypothetical protein